MTIDRDRSDITHEEFVAACGIIPLACLHEWLSEEHPEFDHADAETKCRLASDAKASYLDQARRVDPQIDSTYDAMIALIIGGMSPLRP